MSDSSLTSISTTATAAKAANASSSNMIISISELARLIAHPLQLRDLRACILVSRHWNQHFSPFLWHTIDTRVRPWLKTFREHDYLGDDHHHRYKQQAQQAQVRQSQQQQSHLTFQAQQQRKRDEIVAWVRGLVARHGQHVTRLSVNWNIVLEAASFNQECRSLCELVVGNVAYHRAAYPLTVEIVAAGLPIPPVTTVQKPASVFTTTTTATMTTATMTTATAEDEENLVVQWLHLPWASNCTAYRPQEVNEELRRKITIERFWVLVHQNPGLVRLSFPNLGAMNDLSKEYIFASLASLQHLRDLDVGMTLLDPRVLLTSLPKLERMQIYNLDGLLSIDARHQFTGLQSLGLRTYVPISQVLKVLSHLPCLECLWIKGILSEPLPNLTSLTNTTNATRHKLPLKILHIDETLARDDEYIALFVGQCPGLVRIRGMIGALAVKALWEGCFFLEEMKSAFGDVEDWRMRREVQKGGGGEREI